jgi:hypothetical protein
MLVGTVPVQRGVWRLGCKDHIVRQDAAGKRAAARSLKSLFSRRMLWRAPHHPAQPDAAAPAGFI